MNESPTHSDIIRRVEKIEIDVAVLDSKSNRLHQDVKDVRQDVKDVDVKMDKILEKVDEATLVTKKNQMYLLAFGSVVGGLYTIIQIIKNIHIL
jgi:uncharacterized protein YoxC